MRLWPKTKDRGWYGPFDLVEDLTSPIEKGASWATKDRAWTDWLKDKGSDIEKSRVGGAILSTSPSVGVAYGDEGVQAQAGLNRAQGGPSLTVGQGQRGQENKGRDWGGTIMSLLPILAQGAGSYMQYGREEKDRKRMADAQKFSDWVNVIAGRNVSTPQFTPSKVSGWEKLANIGGQALQMGQQQRAQAEQNRLRELQIQAAQGSLEAQRAQQEMLQGRGMAVQQQQARAQDTGPGEGDYVVGGGEVATVEAPRIPLTPYQAVGVAEEEKTQKLYDLQVQAQEVGLELTNLKLDHQRRLLEMPDTEAVLKVASAFGAVTPGLSEEDFFNAPMVVNVGLGRPLTPEQKMAMYATYKLAARDQAGVLEKRDRDRLDIFQGNMQKEKTVQIRNDIRQAMTEMTTAFKVKGAQGLTDIQLLKLLARMQDPGSVVREAEYNTLAQAIPIFEQAGIMLGRLTEGDRLNDAARAAIYQLGVEAYNNRMGDINRIAEGYIASETMPRFGMDSPETVQLFQIAANPFRLPALDEKVVQDIIGREDEGAKLIDIENQPGSFVRRVNDENPAGERENLEDIITKTGGRPTAGTTNIMPLISGLKLW